MRTYKGKRFGEFSVTVTVWEDGKYIRSLDTRSDLVNHSPDGFEWGYVGSGPAQLALALLADLYGDEIVIRNYQKFKFDVIANLTREKGWEITSSQIEDWMEEAKRLERKV